MMLRIPQVIAAAQLQVIVPPLQDVPFIDGKRSAGMHARRVKAHQERPKKAEITRYLQKIVTSGLNRARGQRDGSNLW